MDSNDSPNFDLPAPNVFLIAEDDLSWTVRCELDQIVELFRNPAGWMEALSRAAGQVLTLTKHFTVEMKSPGARVAATGGDTTVVVMGISGTGYLSIQPSALASDTGFKMYPEWERYWQEWEDDKITPMQVTILTEDGLCYGHLELTKQDDRERGDRLACFMITASSDVERFNRLMGKRPPTEDDVNVVPSEGPDAASIKTARKGFEPIGPATLSAMTFLLVTEQAGRTSTCCLPSGEWVVDNASMFPNGTTVKDYRLYAPDPDPDPRSEP
ncbi:hypothetical protein EON79_13790 [bacterium]|nr:MAG: hypothetical protein EON79_13790 [bacterium]